MTIRDIGILFGYKVDQASEQKVEGSIKSLKSMAPKFSARSVLRCPSRASRAPLMLR